MLRGSHARIHPHIRPRPTFTQVFPRHLSPGAAAPAATPTVFSISESGSPAYLQQAYDLTYLSQTAGVGDTIAIVDAFDDPTAESDLAYYRSFWGLPACTSASGCLRKVNESGASSPLPGTNSDWEQEISLDLDAVSALCPNCHIILVETNSNSDADLYAGIATAQSLGANQISNSWGTTTSSTAPTSFSSAGVIASTGDNGYLGAGNNDYPAGFPGVTAVGGTTLTGGEGTSGERGYSESAWSLSGGEGGGSGCDLSQPKPSYQTDTGCAGRSYADVSADADPQTGLFSYDTAWGGWMLMGGTSLASPLTAAFEAVTQVNGTTPQWAYADSGRLNDPVTGSTGTCAQDILYICNAGVGYDGPTGAGSISGAVVTGAPGIGGPTSANDDYTVTVGPQTAALTGGVYPNGLDTNYFWQYGTSTSYGQQTSATDVGAGTTPVAAPVTLGGLTPSTTYHYRLVAQNSVGTTYGYDFTFDNVGRGPAGQLLAPGHHRHRATSSDIERAERCLEPGPHLLQLPVAELPRQRRLLDEHRHRRGELHTIGD